MTVSVQPGHAVQQGHAVQTGQAVQQGHAVQTGQAVQAGRRHLPRVRPGQTLSFEVGGAEGTLTAGAHPDGQLGEIFLRWGKQGTAVAGLAEAFSVVTSLALQHGVPVETIAARLRGLRFEPAGVTDDPEIPEATSVLDYLARRLLADFPSGG